MDNAVETVSGNESNPVLRTGLFSRFGLMASILGCFIVVASIVAAIQSKLQAQSELIRARQAAMSATVALRSQALSQETESPSGSYYNTRLPSEAIPNHVPRSAQRIERIKEPNTGGTYPMIGNFPAGNTLQAPRVEIAMESDLDQLARQYRNATPANQESIGRTLTQKLTEVFEARHQEQVSRADKLRAELQQTQELLDKRVQLKSKIIERRLKELTGQQDELSWNPQVANSSPTGVTSDYLPGPMDNDHPQNARSWPNPNLTNGSRPIDNPPMYVPQMEELPIAPPVMPTRSPTPLSNLPLDSRDEPSLTYPIDSSPIPASSENESKATAARSFMAAGFKLKKLIRELEEAKGRLGNAHPQLSAMKSAVDEAKAVWDFEKHTLTTELEASESELAIVQMQRDIAIDQQKRLKQLIAAGSASVEESTVAERNVLAAEREMLQLRFRTTSAKNSVQWANDFEEKSLNPIREAPANLM